MSFVPSTPLNNPNAKRLSFDSLGSPLFSPSAAARYAAQTEQWSQVDKWLARVFHPNRVPAFERNEETLAYLLSLSTMAIQRTKEKQALMAAQQQMIEVYKQHEAKLENKLHKVGLDPASLEPNLIQRLDEIAELGMVLGVDPLDTTVFDIAKAMSDQIDTEHDLKYQSHELQTLQTSLEEQLSCMNNLKMQLEETQRNQALQQDTIDDKISEWTRGIKHLQAKTEEYLSRSTCSQPIPEEIRISSLVKEEAKVVELKQRVAELQKQVDGYAMLPHDPKAAKKEVEKLKGQLERLRRKRDVMWDDVTKG